MTPDELSKSNTEHAHQRAFFAYCKYAELRGWQAANLWADMANVRPKTPASFLKWIHSVPNGAYYGAKSGGQGAKMRAEGLKPGVWDVAFDFRTSEYSGLKIEFKKPKEFKENNPLAGLSKEQIEYRDFIIAQGFKCSIAYNWRQAVLQLQKYLIDQ